MQSNLIQKHLNDALKHFVFSGYQLYAEQGSDRLSLYGGRSSYWPKAKDIKETHLFDIGSITKVFATTSIVARLLEREELALQDVLGQLIPDFKGTRYETLSVESLLTHSAGLRAWYPLYKEVRSASELLHWFLKNPDKAFAHQPLTKTEYSDLGFLLLHLVLEECFGSLDILFKNEVVKPLHLEKVVFGPIPPEKTVATEYVLEEKRVVQGEVFDENARALGGVAAHAGLFSAAVSFAPWCRAWLSALKGESQWLSKQVSEKFAKRRELIMGSDRGLGFDLKSKLHSTAGEFFSLSSFGHLGYTGCSVWMDPEVQGFAVFLSNRVHPSRFDERIKKVRPVLHDAIAKRWRKQ